MVVQAFMYLVQLQLSFGEVLDDEHAVDPGVHGKIHDVRPLALVEAVVDDVGGELLQTLAPFQKCFLLPFCRLESSSAV